MARPFPDAWSRHRLTRRVVLLVGVGALIPLILIAWAADAGLQVLEQQVAVAREAHAARVAANVEHRLDDAFAALAGIPAEAASLPHPPRSAPAYGEALHRVRLRARALASVFLLDARGAPLAWDPGELPPVLSERVLAVVVESGRPVVAGSEPHLVLLLPFAGPSGRLVAGALLDPRSRAWSGVFDEPVSGASVALLAEDGTPLVTAGGAVVARDGARAEARVPGTGLRVSVEGGDTQNVGAVARLERALLLAGGLAVLVALGLAWGAARSITQPLERLTQEAERLMDGDLEAPLPGLGDDEIGVLGAALESMRQSLREAFASLRGANQALEERVERRTRQLAAANEALLDREKRRAELLRKVISAQEEERQRVARELHDETGQTLASLKLLLERAGERSGEGDARLERARALASRGLDSLHQLMFDLRPSVLDDLGLRAALRSFATRHLEPLGLKVSCEFEPGEERLPPEVETALFRAAQEVLKNVGRHAGAEHVLLQVVQEPDEMRIEIEDDGRGFDPAQAMVPAPSGRGLGLLGVRERLELVGGRAEIDSAPSEGTRVVLRVPLDGAA